LHVHLREVAELAGRFATGFGAEKAATLAGLLHDLGKYSAAFQARLNGGKPVDHATAGARAIRELVGKKGPMDRLMGEIVAYAIAGHHTGLPDKIGGTASLTDRLQSAIEPLDEIWRSQITPDGSGLWPDLNIDPRDKAKAAFQLAFLGRMIFSCLIDADRRDTEAFCASHEGWTPDRHWPRLPEIIGDLRARFDMHMAEKQATAPDSDVNRLRNEILVRVRASASQPAGLFTLTVPTGGGKTLASLAFALDHAKAHGLQRIVYAIPFTSVVDQTASVFRQVLGSDVILEHHSAIEDESKERSNRDEPSGKSKLRLAMEDWAAPIVVTTNVQLFESLFAARPLRCRKLHNLARSVIILDEAQTIPLPYLRPCAAALDELARNFGASIVLCTATQPALDERHFKPGGLKLEGRELAPDPQRLARELKRVHVAFGAEMDDDALVEALASQQQGLVIVNSRGHALSLFQKVRNAGLPGAIHLTTRQYAAHRRIILADVRERLRQGEPCRLVATSLVEAGVDLDFPGVWRAEAGLDQIAQAAGRCNREGSRPLEDSIVTIFKAPDNPPPREIAQLSADFARMADKHADLLSPAAIEDYFREVYWRKGDGLDAKDILRDFALSGAETSFAYRSVAEKFRMIESGMEPVIVAREEEARGALEKLRFEGTSPGGVARDLQNYIVQVPPRARLKLIATGHVRFENERLFGDQFAVLRTDSLYKEDVGLVWDDTEYLEAENLIF
jgi:CRISPR-associated endonuclease/helicase Cas3